MRLRESVRFLRAQSAPGPKCKSKDKQIQSNRGHRGHGQAGARSPSADVAIRWHKPPASCSSHATGAGGRWKRPADLAGFTHKSFFLPPPILPRSQWVLGLQLGHRAARCHEDDGRDGPQRLRFAARRDGQGAASAACRGFIQQQELERIGTELRQMLQQHGVHTGMEQPRKYFVQ